MFEFSDVYFDKIAVHNVGNRQSDEKLNLSKSELEIDEEIINELLLKYFLKPFKEEIFYKFYHETDIELNEVYSYCKKIFNNDDEFFNQSVNLAKHLYENSNHPKIKGGEFYVVYFNNVWIGDEEVDAIGLFKSENKDTFLKVYSKNNNFEIEHDKGININKLDKGCLVFNTSEEDGYKTCIVDTVSKGEEALYWKEYFLHLKAVEDNYFHTKNYMKMCKSYVDDIYNQENDIPKTDQIDMLNSTVNFFKDNEKFDKKEFEETVFEAQENIQSFQAYQEKYKDEQDIQVVDNFDISKQAVKGTKKVFKSVLKLDKNFHVYIHGNRSYIERGFDDETNMNFYKLFFEKES